MLDETKIKHYWLYVLTLEDSCYYVGVTSLTPKQRFKQHQSEFLAAEWTKLHKPIKILDTRDLGLTTYAKAQAFENRAVRRYIRTYGINNVRGGDVSYSRKLVVLFSYPMEQEHLVAALGIAFMMMVILYLEISYVLK